MPRGGRTFVACWGYEQFFPLNIGGTTWDEEEIFGQLIQISADIFSEGFESGYTFAWR